MSDQSESEPLAMALSQSPTPAPRIYGINDLPENVHGKIFNYLDQKEVPNIALVCKQWKKAIDEYYEFEWIVGYGVGWFNWMKINNPNYDEKTVFKPFMKKCTKCTFLKLNLPTFDENFQFMKYPTYLKKLRILGPLEPQYLQHIVSSSIKLEKLIFEGFSDFPNILSLAQTPGLAKLRNLNEIWCKPDSENYSAPDSGKLDAVSAFMDCHFPKLEYFTLDLGSRTIKPALLWKFLKVHSSSLRRFWFWDTCTQSVPLSLTQSQQEEFGTLDSLNLVALSIMTSSWSPIWARIVSQQSILEILHFTLWDVVATDESPQIPVPWIVFQAPIINSSDTLRSVELGGLSMIVGSRCRPLDLSVFRSCDQLTNLELKGVEEGGQDVANPDEEILLMINGHELPTSLTVLCITELPMLSTDLLLTVTKLENLRYLQLWYVGKTGNLGITSSVLQATSLLENLEALDIAQLNTSDPVEYETLEILIESIGKDFQGSLTWFTLDDAHVQLSVLQQVQEG